MAGATSSEKKKRTVRKWLPEENEAILEYLSETVKMGFAIEKPNALKYYEKLIASKNLKECNPGLVKNKVRNLETTFKAALLWKRETGQGILESEGEASFEEVLLRRYPHLHLMEEVWGEKSNIVPPFVADSARPADRTPATHYAIDEDGNLVTLDDQLDEPETCDPLGTHEMGDAVKETVVSSMSSEDGMKKASKNLLKAVKGNGTTKGVTTAKSAYEEIMKQREVSLQQKVKIEEDKLALERERFQSSAEIERNRLDLEKAKLDFEMEIKRKELDITEMKMKNDAEIRLKELEIEHLKLLQAKH